MHGACLKKAIAAGFVALDYAARDPDLACVHDEPGFGELLEDLRRKEAMGTVLQAPKL